MLKKMCIMLFTVVIVGLLIIPGGNLKARNVIDGEKNISENKIETKTRIMVVSSYHREYIWSQHTNKGLCAALLEFGYLDNQQQTESYTKNDYVESSRVIVKKSWMDTKRKNSKSEMAQSLARVIAEIDDFQPDILLLGDDNAANYISNQYFDTETPIVFWGINGLPLKYGIIDSLTKPGHNVTGIYQRGYYIEAFAYFHKIVPGLKTIAVLADDSPTGRAHAKKVQRYAEEGELIVDVAEIVITNSFAEWKSKALELQSKVDGFYISTHNTLKDEKGNHVNYLKASSWYLRNIQKPEVVVAKFGVEEGFLCTVDDSAFKQGYEAMKLAHKILVGANPAELSVYSPTRGPFIVNRKRAKMLGLENSIRKNEEIIDEYINEMVALEKYPE